MSLHGGVSNVATGEQRRFSMNSQITHVRAVPDAGSTLGLLGLAMLSLVAIRRYSFI